jgi:hypothetical protein
MSGREDSRETTRMRGAWRGQNAPQSAQRDAAKIHNTTAAQYPHGASGKTHEQSYVHRSTMHARRGAPRATRLVQRVIRVRLVEQVDDPVDDRVDVEDRLL